MAGIPKRLTVQQVIDWVPRLGIPHFQRGLVWGEDSTAALLESLLYETPCGSFVLWKPRNCAKYGVPLEAEDPGAMEYLIIDGQQRIRNIHAAFTDAPLSSDEADGDDSQDGDEPNRERIWCINLPKLPAWSTVLQPQQRDYALFVRTVDPALRKDDKRPSPLLRNVIPLNVVRRAESWDAPVLAPYRALTNPSESPELHRRLSELYRGLYQDVTRMMQQEFFVSVQSGDDLGEMVNLYNRINSGGKRVEVEERAFAKLVGLQTGTYAALSQLFEAIHGDSRQKPARQAGGRLSGGRDSVLERRKERAFGFKLFVKVFLQVCQHHFGYVPGKTDFTFDLIRRGPFLAAFQGRSEAEVTALWGEAGRVLGTVRRTLRDQLFCDDLRFLPDTRALTPVFQLLIHYPALTDARYRPLLAALCLRLILADLGSKEIQQLVALAASPRHVAFEAIPRVIELADGAFRKKLGARLEAANSIQNRHVLVLYWLERSLGARDFRYENIDARKNSPLSGRDQIPVSEDATPEKQHIVPFSRAGLVYQANVRRGDAHPFNNVGNLTYISRLLNHFETGLGDDFVNLAAELPPDKLAHLLESEAGDARIVKAYEAVRKALGEDGKAAAAADGDVRKQFEAMTARRRRLIEARLLRWLETLDGETCERLGVSTLAELKSLTAHQDRLEPIRPRFPAPQSLDVAYEIRSFNFNPESEDRLIQLAGAARKKILPTAANPRLQLSVTRRPWVWCEVSDEGLFVRFTDRVLAGTRSHIRGLLGIAATGGDRFPVAPIPDFKPLLDELGPIEAMLEQDAKATQTAAKKAG
jgi:hypothetical protein